MYVCCYLFYDTVLILSSYIRVAYYECSEKLPDIPFFVLNYGMEQIVTIAQQNHHTSPSL